MSADAIHLNEFESLFRVAPKASDSNMEDLQKPPKDFKIQRKDKKSVSKEEAGNAAAAGNGLKVKISGGIVPSDALIVVNNNDPDQDAEMQVEEKEPVKPEPPLNPLR